MPDAKDMLVYYMIIGLVLTFIALPYLTNLKQNCGNTYVQCVPAWDQTVKNFWGSSYVAGTSEFNMGLLILIGGLLFFWIVLPALYVAIRYMVGGAF